MMTTQEKSDLTGPAPGDLRAESPGDTQVKPMAALPGSTRACHGIAHRAVHRGPQDGPRHL